MFNLDCVLSLNPGLASNRLLPITAPDTAYDNSRSIDQANHDNDSNNMQLRFIILHAARLRWQPTMRACATVRVHGIQVHMPYVTLESAL